MNLESAVSTNLADISNPMSEALNNSLILDNILKVSTNLKNCRRVCKQWNDTILSQTPPKFTMKLQNTVPRMEKKLAKEISISYKPMCCSYHLEDRFSRFLNNYADAVEHLKFDDDERYFDNLKTILEDKLFPNLRCLEGSFLNCPDYSFNLPIMPKLEVISTKISNSNKNLLQLLIKNAPNLQEIMYEGPLEMDFSQNHDLSSLSIKRFHDSEPKLVAEGLETMLTQISSSLEKLKINFHSSYDEDDDDDLEDQMNVSFPYMPKLVSLELNSNCGSQIGLNFDNLGPNLLPSLKILKLSSNPFEKQRKHTELTILTEMAERKGKFQHDGILKLSLHQVGYPDLLKDLPSFFPNLQSLEVEVMLTKGNSPREILATLLMVLIELKLKTIKIIIPFRYDTLELVQGLGPSYEKLFEEGLKRFYLENLSHSNTDTLDKGSSDAFQNGYADPIEIFEKILLQLKNAQGLEVVFQNFVFNATTVQRILGFIAENKIPITFK